MNRRSSVPELLALLAAWGPVGECHPADLNNDGVVDVSDLLILLANWGPCPTAALGTTVPSLQEAVNGAGLHMDGWDAFVHVMTDMEGDHDKENWNCWMRNYLMQCTACPACPSSDPLVRYRLD